MRAKTIEAEHQILKGAEPLFSEGNKTGILLLHGFTGSPYEMKELGLSLQKKGYTVSVPLLCGHGTSEKELMKCNWYDWFENTKQALFQLRKSCTRVMVVGLSTGATLALHLAAHYQVDGVVAMSPALILKGLSAKFIPFVPPFIRYHSKDGGPDISDAEARRKAVSYQKTPIKAAKQILKLYAHVKMDLPEIYAPVLIIQADKDHVVDAAGARLIYDNISSSNKQFLKLSKSFHVITLDVEKEIVFREVEQFISAHI